MAFQRLQKYINRWMSQEMFTSLRTRFSLESLLNFFFTDFTSLFTLPQLTSIYPARFATYPVMFKNTFLITQFRYLNNPENVLAA